MYIIHAGDHYYPDAYEYDTLEEAKEAFAQRKIDRAEEMRSYPMFDKDYLCEVIDVIDKEKMEREMP